MIGFPSVGKSSLLSTVTKTDSEVAEYAFTTLTCIAGVVEYKDAKIQLLDMPGIIQGAAQGKGRGKQVIAAARTADLVLMVLEAEKADRHKELLTYELESVGIRINKSPPDVNVKMKKTGGVHFTTTVEQPHGVDEEMVKRLCQLYKIHNCDVLAREPVTPDELIDAIEGNRIYMRCLYVVNKIDTISLDEVDKLAHEPDHCVISIKMKFGLDHLLEKMWEYLDFIRMYTKPRGRRPDFNEPVIMRNGCRVEDVCNRIHRDFAAKFKYALVWGTSAKHQPQRVGLTHALQDEDVIQLNAAK